MPKGNKPPATQLCDDPIGGKVYLVFLCCTCTYFGYANGKEAPSHPVVRRPDGGWGGGVYPVFLCCTFSHPGDAEGKEAKVCLAFLCCTACTYPGDPEDHRYHRILTPQWGTAD